MKQYRIEDTKEQVIILKQDTTTTLPTTSTSITTSTSHYLTEEKRQEMVRETLEGLTAEMLFTQSYRTMEQVVGGDMASNTHTEEHSVVMDVVNNSDGGEKGQKGHGMVHGKVLGSGEERGKENEKGGKRRREEEEVEDIEAKKRESYEGENDINKISTVREGIERDALLQPTNPTHLPSPSTLPPALHSSLLPHLHSPPPSSLHRPLHPPPPLPNPNPAPHPDPCPGPVSSLKRVAVSDIEIDTHVTHILNHTFPRSSFGSDLWREQR